MEVGGLLSTRISLVKAALNSAAAFKNSCRETRSRVFFRCSIVEPVTQSDSCKCNYGVDNKADRVVGHTNRLHYVLSKIGIGIVGLTIGAILATLSIAVLVSKQYNWTYLHTLKVFFSRSKKANTSISRRAIGSTNVGTIEKVVRGTGFETKPRWLGRLDALLAAFFLSGCTGPYQKAELTPGFILFVIVVFFIGFIGTRILLSWAEDYMSKVRIKRFNKRHGFTDEELERLDNFRFSYIKRWAEMLRAVNKDSQPREEV